MPGLVLTVFEKGGKPYVQGTGQPEIEVLATARTYSRPPASARKSASSAMREARSPR